MFKPHYLTNMEFKPNYKLRTKDIAFLEDCSTRTADRIKRAIKILFGIEVVKYRDYVLYYSLSYDEVLEIKKNRKSTPK